MPRVSCPVLGVFENVEKAALRHSGTDLPFEFSQILWRRGGRQFSETRRAVGVQPEFFVAGKTSIGFGRGGRRFVAQHGGEICSAPGYANGRAPRRELWFAFGPGQQLRAVIAICFDSGHVRIARSQPVRDMGEDANLKRPPVKIRPPPMPPPHGSRASGAAQTRGSMVCQLLLCVCLCARITSIARRQRMIPRGWLDVQQIEKAEQHATMTRVNRPEERKIVAAMPGADGVASGGQFGGPPCSENTLCTSRPKFSSVCSAVSVRST